MQLGAGEAGLPKDKKPLVIGVVVGLLPAVGILWAFAVTAAEHVMAPHLASSRARVYVMCAIEKVRTQNEMEICKKLGASCTPINVDDFLFACQTDK